MTTITAPVAPHDDDILSEADAAAIVHESSRNFRQRRYDGTGPAYIEIGKSPLYRRGTVMAWLLDHERPSGPRSDEFAGMGRPATLPKAA